MLQSDPKLLRPLPNLFRPKVFGFDIGFTIKDSAISQDPFKYPVLDRKDSFNESILIEGSSGSGKNFLAFLLGVKLALHYNQPLIFFDLKGDYRGSNKMAFPFASYFDESRVFVPVHYLSQYSESDKLYFQVTDSLILKDSILSPESIIRLSKLDPSAQYTRYLEKAFREVGSVSLSAIKQQIEFYISSTENQNLKKSLSVLLGGIESLMDVGLFSQEGFDFDSIFNKKNRCGIYVFSFLYPDLNRFDLYGILLNQLFEYCKRNPEAYPIVILDEIKLSAPAKRYMDSYTEYSSQIVSKFKEMGRGKRVMLSICQSRKDLLESFIDSPCPITFTFYDRRRCLMLHDIKKLKGYFYVGNCPIDLKT